MVIRLLSVLLLLPAALSAWQWGDYHHDYLLPEEREGPFQFYGFAGFGWEWAEEEKDGGGVEWDGETWRGSSAGVWLTGSLAGRLRYFAEGFFLLENEKGELGPAYADGEIGNRALSLRGGRFHLPVGLEGRSAPLPVNPFVIRSWVRVPTATGIACYGDFLDESVNYYLALGKSFAGDFADSLLGPAAPAGGEEDPLTYAGRIALSPREGLEFGFSRSADAESGGGGSADLVGADLSLSDGPLLVRAEWVRLWREEGGAERRSDGVSGRIGYRIIEYSRRFDAATILLGIDYLDPSGDRSNDRLYNYIAGLSFAPRFWGVLKAEFQTTREESGGRLDRVLVEFLLRR